MRIKKPNPRLRQDLWTSLFGRGICETPEPQPMGSRYRAGTGDPTEGLQGVDYLISVTEQSELDCFLTENLETGCIWQFKSPMAFLLELPLLITVRIV
jgi:hypothetical protein